jgi:hypothetical protein
VTDRFTDKYLEYAKEFTDCPDVFLSWGALLAISASLSRCVYVEIGSWNIAPHLWVIVIGKSSSHKSTAISIVEDLIEVMDSERSAPHEFSAEAIITSLSKSGNRLFIFDEAKGFFDMIAKKYNESLKSLFTILYRKPTYSRETLKHGRLQITNAYIPMGMATTPEWLRASLQDAEQSAMSGFLARFLMVPYNGNGNHPISMPPPHDPEKFRVLSEMLRQFSYISQPFKYAVNASAFMDEWYHSVTKRENESLPVLGPFFEHIKNEAIHKLGVIFAVDRGEREITLASVKEATLALSYVEEMLPSLVEDLTDNRMDRERRKIVTFIKTHGTCKREELAFAVHVHGENLSKHLAGLINDDLITSAKVQGKTRSITALTWIGEER